MSDTTGNVEGTRGPIDEPWEDRYPDLPAALGKAIDDPFDYALGLRTGQIVFFTSASLSKNRQWVHLDLDNSFVHRDQEKGEIELPFERGLDVRVADIVWVADAPYGS